MMIVGGVMVVVLGGEFGQGVQHYYWRQYLFHILLVAVEHKQEGE